MSPVRKVTVQVADHSVGYEVSEATRGVAEASKATCVYICMSRAHISKLRRLHVQFTCGLNISILF